jgi:DNA-binding CsgD family transcriptional regulator
VPEFTSAVARTLRRVIPFEGICLLTTDPATLLPTSEVVENGLPPSARVRLTEIELGEPDVNKFTSLARAEVPAASLSAATDGDLDRSPRHSEVRRAHGFGDELRAVLTGPTGSWGSLTLLREMGRPNFTTSDVGFMASLTATLADGVRRAMLLDDAPPGDRRSEMGLLVVAADNTVVMANAAAEGWLDELSPLGAIRTELPVAVRAVVTQTRRVAAGEDDVMANARVRTRHGRWAIVRGTLVGADQVAVLVEAPRPAELATAMSDAYGLTERERTVTALVARGMSTKEIAADLHLSTYTVQDHLKAVFERTGTATRGALVARMFFDHYLPLLSTPPPA